MATAALKQEVDILREYMKELSYQAMRTEMSVARLAEEMQVFKDTATSADMAVARLAGEMREFKDEMRIFKDTATSADMAVARLAGEMREFKDEMRVFKDTATGADTAVTRLAGEMREFKDEMGEFKDEMREFKDEMREFKDEMQEYKEEGKRERQRMNKQWGDLANRLGTLVEDIVAPNLPRVAAELFSCEQPDLFALRVVRRFGGEAREYDAMVVCPRVVLVNETKSRLLEAHVDAILDKLSEFPRIVPEYADRRAVGILASLYPDERVVRRATRKGVLVMGMGEETMQVLNPGAVPSGI